jgi:hypothetical protein
VFCSHQAVSVASRPPKTAGESRRSRKKVSARKNRRIGSRRLSPPRSTGGDTHLLA